MYQTHREAFYADVAYNPPQSLPPNPPHFHSLSSDSAYSHHPPPPPLPLDPYPNSGPHPPNYNSFEDRPAYYQDPNPSSSNWVARQAPPVRYSPVRQPLIQEPDASAEYDAALYRNWAAQNLIANSHRRRLKRPKTIMKKKTVSQNVKCKLCKIECTSVELYEKHLSGRKHTNNLQKLYAPKIASQAGKTSTGSSGGKRKAGATKGDLQTKKQKLLEGGTSVQSVKVCSICNVACNGEIAFADHMAGKKHLAQERALSKTANPKPTSATNPKAKPKEKTTKKVNNAATAWCEVCKISCTSNEGLEVHKQGKKHKKNLEKLQNPKADPPKPASAASKPPSAKSKEPEDVETKKRKVLESGTAEDAVKTCTVCNVVCNSETVFKAHLAGQKHAAMVKQKAAEEAGTADVADGDGDGDTDGDGDADTDADGQQPENESPAS